MSARKLFALRDNNEVVGYRFVTAMGRTFDITKEALEDNDIDITSGEYGEPVDLDLIYIEDLGMSVTEEEWDKEVYVDDISDNIDIIRASLNEYISV